MNLGRAYPIGDLGKEFLTSFPSPQLTVKLSKGSFKTLPLLLSFPGLVQLTSEPTAF